MARSSTKDSERIDEVDPFESDLAWRSGSAAGLVAAVAMGLAMGVTEPDVFDSIAGLYGLQGGLLVGWLAHVVHGVLFGLVFAVVLADPGLSRAGHEPRTTAVVGLVYGVILAVVAAGIIMPMWQGLMGVVDAPTLPNVTVESVLWHAVYGVVLGLVFSRFYRR